MFVVNRHFSFPVLRNLRLTFLSLGRGLRHGPRGLALVLRAIRDGWAGRLGRREDLGRDPCATNPLFLFLVIWSIAIALYLGGVYTGLFPHPTP